MEKNYTRPYMDIRKSTIRNAGNGVFATMPIPANVILDEYKGQKISVKKASSEHMDNNYLFAIEKKDQTGISHIVDAEDPMKGNWTRFVNGAKTPAQKKRINVLFKQYGKKMYLETLRNLSPGEEMICDYGPLYW
jgi:SET domain-containing protein